MPLGPRSISVLSISVLSIYYQLSTVDCLPSRYHQSWKPTMARKQSVSTSTYLSLPTYLRVQDGLCFNFPVRLVQPQPEEIPQNIPANAIPQRWCYHGQILLPGQVRIVSSTMYMCLIYHRHPSISTKETRRLQPIFRPRFLRPPLELSSPSYQSVHSPPLTRSFVLNTYVDMQSEHTHKLRKPRNHSEDRASKSGRRGGWNL